MKLIVTAAALVAGFPIAAHAAAPTTDQNQHEQHQQQRAPQGQTRTPPAQSSTTPPSHQHGGMGEGMHQGMEMDGCCCCKHEAQQAQKPCRGKDEAPPSPSGEPHDHNH